MGKELNYAEYPEHPRKPLSRGEVSKRERGIETGGGQGPGGEKKNHLKDHSNGG